MIEQTYLIALDATTDLAAVKDYFKNESAFTHWWNHVPAVFLVTSTLTANQITERPLPITGDASLLVIGVKPNEAQGWLPQRSWTWIKHRARDMARTSSDLRSEPVDHG